MVTIGESTAVCIVVNNLTWVVMEDESRKYSQVLITPKADEFSRFTVSGSWNSSTNSLDPIVTTFGTEVGVHVESLGKYSFQKAFRLKSENKTFPLHTAIIAVHKGEVTGISWDDGCHFCSSSDCQENTYDYSGELAEESGPDCYWPDESCNEAGTESNVSSLCQLTVYVVWSGTDSKGNYFTSSSKRLSMYAGNTIDSLIEDAADTYQKTIEPADS
ncbi:unnamed protein product [Ascophyllum nodosum]